MSEKTMAVLIALVAEMLRQDREAALRLLRK